jgi:NTE family protein
MRPCPALLAGEDHSKDIDFSAKGIRARWEAGHADTKRALMEMPWNREFDRTEGFILHEVHAGRVMAGDEIRGTLSAKSS